MGDRDGEALAMKIAVVHPGNDWILSRIARSICDTDRRREDGQGTFVDVSFEAVRSGCWPQGNGDDAVVYWDVQSCWQPIFRDLQPKAWHIGAFTHLDRDAVEAFRPSWDTLDGIVHMCQRYLRVFERQGWYPAKRMTVIPPGQPCGDVFTVRPLRLGVSQRGGFPGKGDPFLFEALVGLPEVVKEHVELQIKGSGWSQSLERFRDELRPLAVRLSESEGYASYSAFYESLDYLLVPSLWEGGPMAVPEALACGVPVIAADVGWIPEMLTMEWDSGSRVLVSGCRMFPPGNREALQMHITSLVQERLDRRRRVENMTWKGYAQKLEAFVETLK